MVLDLQERLKANEGLDNTYLPVETDAQFKMPVPLFTATIVNYEKPKAIGIVRWLAGLIHIPVQGGHLNFSRADYAMVGDLKSSTTMMSTFLESRTQHVQNSRNFPQEPYFGEEIKKESDALKNLEPNGKLRLHSDFIIIQFNGQCRVYLLDKLPSNMRRIAEREQEKMAARPIL